MKAIIILLLSGLVCTKILTKEENRVRAEKCGRVVEESAVEVPWLARINSTTGTSSFYTTGFLISQRHALTLTSTILYKRQQEFIWKFHHGVANMSNCTDQVLDIPQQILSGLKLRICASKVNCSNGNESDVSPKKGYYIGNCDTNLEPYGLLLLEIAESAEEVNPICLGESSVGDKVRLFGLSDTPPGLYKGETTIHQCEETTFANTSFCVENIGCTQDQGGPYFKTTSGRSEAVGVKYYGTCGTTETGEQPDLKYYLPKICDLTGICNFAAMSTTKMPSTKESTNSSPVSTTTTATNDSNRKPQKDQEKVTDCESEAANVSPNRIHHINLIFNMYL